MKARFLLTLAVPALCGTFTACDEKDNEIPAQPVTIEDVTGNVLGIWTKNSTVNVSGHIVVPEGQTLTIEEGVQVIFDDDGVGIDHTGIEMKIGRAHV